MLHQYSLNGSGKAMGIVERKGRSSIKRGLSLVLAGGNKERGLANEGFVGQRRGTCPQLVVWGLGKRPFCREVVRL